MPQNSKNKALIIGVGQRPGSRDASDMNICIRDAEAMARALKICSSVHHPICLTGPDTTCANIKTQLERLNDSGDVADLTVVYFSGHGIHKNGQYFLVGYDSSDESSALDGSIFLALLSNIKTQKLLVLLDCCHSGGFAQSAHIPFEYQHFLQKKNTNRVILTACNAGQKSLLATPNSNFTYAILEALEGQPITPVLLFDLAMYVSRTVAAYSSGRQYPQLNALKDGLTSNFRVSAGGDLNLGPRSYLPGEKAAETFEASSVEHEFNSKFGWVQNLHIDIVVGDVTIQTAHTNIQNVEHLHINTNPFPDFLKDFKSQKTELHDRYENLSNNNLLFFSADEDSKIIDFIDVLKQEKRGLLVGHPASGKSILAYKICSLLQNTGKTIYYFSYKTNPDEAISNKIKALLSENIVLVIDDAHLNHVDANSIFINTGKASSNNAIVFFISRPLDTLVDGLELGLYKKTEGHRPWHTKDGIVDKMSVIIKGHRDTYMKKYPTKTFVINDLDAVIKRLQSDLLAIGFYMETWALEAGNIDDVSEDKMLQHIYSKYLKDLGTKPKELLVHHAAHYCFEIGSPSKSNDAATIDALTNKGLIAVQRNTVHFYHSNFAKLLVQSYANQFDELAQDLLLKSFKKLFKKFPEWIHKSFDAIVKTKSASFNNKNSVLKIDVPTLVFTLATQQKDEIPPHYKNQYRDAWYFILLLCRNAIERGDKKMDLFLDYFRELIAENEASCRQDDVAIVYSVLFEKLRNNSDVWGRMLALLGPSQEIEIFQYAKLNFLGDALYRIHLSTPNKAKEIFSQLPTEPDYWAGKLEQVKLVEIHHGLGGLHAIDPVRIVNILNAPSNRGILLQKAQESTLGEFAVSISSLSRLAPSLGDYIETQYLQNVGDIKDISLGELTNFFAHLHTTKSATYQHLLNSVSAEDLSKKIKQEQTTLFFIGVALNIIKTIDPKKALETLTKIPLDALVQKAHDENFSSLGQSLICLNSVQKSIAHDIYSAIPNTVLLQKIEHSNFTKISQAMNELHDVSPAKSELVLSLVDYDTLIEKAKQEDISKITSGIHELCNVSLAKGRNILHGFSIDEMVDLLKPKDCSYNIFSQIVTCLDKIDRSFATRFFNQLITSQQITAEELVKSIRETKHSSYISRDLNMYNRLDQSENKSFIHAVLDELSVPQADGRTVLKHILNDPKSSLYFLGYFNGLFALYTQLERAEVALLLEFAQEKAFVQWLNKENLKNVYSFLDLYYSHQPTHAKQVTTYHFCQKHIEKAYANLKNLNFKARYSGEYYKKQADEESQWKHIPRFISTVHRIDLSLGERLMKEHAGILKHYSPMLTGHFYANLCRNYIAAHDIKKAHQHADRAKNAYKNALLEGGGRHIQILDELLSNPPTHPKNHQQQ